MSIENTLERIANALEIIAQSKNAAPAPVAAAPVVVAAPVAAPAAPVVAPAPVAPVAPVAAPAPVAPVAAPFTDKQGLTSYTMESYKALGAIKGAKIQDVLGSLGITNINEVTPAMYGQYYASIEALKAS
jgi:hypothetical protein